MSDIYISQPDIKGNRDSRLRALPGETHVVKSRVVHCPLRCYVSFTRNGETGTNMKRTIAIVMLAGASIVAHAQWTGQAQTVESYNWGTQVPPKPQKHRYVRQAYGNPPAYVNTPPTYVNAPPPVPQGAIDAQTGQYLPPVAGGVINPQNGAFYPSVAGGYVNPQTGAFMPAQ